NVPKLNPEQLKNLEKYVADGGGLAVFMGPLVDTKFYNDKMFSKGKGLLPVELKEDTFFPPKNKDKLKPDYIRGVPMLLLRDDDPGLKPLPICGAILTSPDQRQWLDDLPVYRYFRADRPARDNKKGKGSDVRPVYELATLPNDRDIKTYEDDVMDLVRDKK